MDLFPYGRSLFPLRCLVIAGVIIWCAGCTSSVRYTRGKAQVSSAGTYYVPRNWDYRKGYTVPGGRLSSVAARYLGIPYRYGGMSRKGTDCSGLVCMIYREVNHAKLPHSTKRLRALGRKISLRQARAGDLIFFSRGPFGRVNHVGIYLSGKQFIHASTKLGVIYSDLDDGYYKERFVELRRIF